MLLKARLNQLKRRENQDGWRGKAAEDGKQEEANI